MPWSTPYPILVWAVVALGTAVFLWFLPLKNKLAIFLSLLAYAALNLFFFMTVNWLAVNFYLRFLPIFFWFVIFLRLRGGLKGRPFFPGKSLAGWAYVVIGLLILAASGYLDYRVLGSYINEGDHMLMLLPLRSGAYVVVNGGNGLEGWGMNNYIHDWLGTETEGDLSKTFALDIVEMTARGFMGKGVPPKSHLDYEGFGDVIYSPCMGVVVYVEDGHPDLDVGDQPETDLGNYVVIQCDRFYATLAGFQKNTIDVEPGEEVSFFRWLGRMGSSGYPPIPHLHLYATIGGVTGDAAPIYFEGLSVVDRFVVRNKVFIR
jgi:hypothetical protein